MVTATIEGTEKPKTIHELIPLIREEVGAVRKDQQAAGGAKYNYRGADAVINALVPVLNKYGVFTTVEDSDYTHEERVTGGKVVTIVTLKKRVTFYAPDGSSVFSEVYGENSDYSDKATGGASTYAYRYALLQTFTLPTDEPDSEGKEPIIREAPAQQTYQQRESKGDPVKEGREAIKKLAKEKHIDYMNLATENGLPKENPDWGNDLNLLKKLYKILEAEPAVNPETGEVA